jgi:hypothetical protein
VLDPEAKTYRGSQGSSENKVELKEGIYISHFTRIATKLLNKSLMERLASQRGWTVEFEKVHKNKWTYSKEQVENALVLKQGEKTKLVVAQDGTPIVDSYYMGRDFESFLQQYSVELIKETAMIDGGIVSETVDKQGNIVLVVEYM